LRSSTIVTDAVASSPSYVAWSTTLWPHGEEDPGQGGRSNAHVLPVQVHTFGSHESVAFFDTSSICPSLKVSVTVKVSEVPVGGVVAVSRYAVAFDGSIARFVAVGRASIGAVSIGASMQIGHASVASSPFDVPHPVAALDIAIAIAACLRNVILRIAASCHGAMIDACAARARYALGCMRSPGPTSSAPTSMALVRAASLDEYVREPRGRWIDVGTNVTWCASSSLGGATVWGAPDADTTAAILHSFEGLWAQSMAPQVDVVLDAREVERIDADALAVLLAWLARCRERLVSVVRQQIGVVSPGFVGLTLSGVLPVVGATHPFRVVHDPREAHRLLGGEGALGDEIDALVGAVRGVSSDVRRLRALFDTHPLSLTIADAARALGLSSRTLQRTLSDAGTSFQRELRDARFRAACDRLSNGDDKIAVVARAVGLSEGALTSLFRERIGRTPTEFRRDARGPRGTDLKRTAP
jgi:AraC-like DNA-binding protein